MVQSGFLPPAFPATIAVCGTEPDAMGTARITLMRFLRAMVSKSPLFACAIGGLFSLGIACAQATLVIGRTDEFSPLSDLSEQILRETSRRAGIAIEVRRFPLMRSINMANEGEIDGDLMRIADAVRQFPNLLAVPVPIGRVDIAMYSTSVDIAKWTRADLLELSVGFPRGVLALAKHSTGMRKVVDVGTSMNTTRMLKAGRFDVAMFAYLDRELGMTETGSVYHWPYYWASEPLHLMIHRKHAALIPRLNAALEALTAEKFIDNAYTAMLLRHQVAPLRYEAADLPGQPARPLRGGK